MPAVTAVCPHCQTKLKIAGEAKKRRLNCPKCQGEFSPKDCDVACPKCKVGLPPGSVFCVQCGYDFRAKRTLVGTFIPQKEPVKRDRSQDEPERFPAQAFLDEPTWGEILQTPTNMELVVAEAVILTMWGVFWDLLFIAVTVGYIMASGMLGFGTIFSACMLFAGLLRIWMLTSDISLWTIIRLTAGLILASIAIGWLFETANPAVFESGVVGFIAFLGLVHLGIALRAVSFFMGRYFALCRRAALRKTMSGADRGGLYDLGHGVVLLFAAFFPALVVWSGQLYLTWNELEFPGGQAAYFVLLCIAMTWAYLYGMMGTAVVSLRGSINPAVVADWIGKCFVDYCTMLLCFLPFNLLIVAVKVVVVWGIDHVFQFAPLTGVLLQLFNWVVLSMLLDHYALAATIAGLGLLMRKHEAVLKWAKTARNLERERD